MSDSRWSYGSGVPDTPLSPDPGADPVLRQGEVVDGRYRVDAALGRGGVGVVYAAQDLQAGRPVALKALLPGRVSEARLERFEREGELAARVDARGGIVRVHALGLHRGFPYLVMELVDGQNLEDVVGERGPLPPREAARIVASLARTLTSVHAAGVVHRDIKPANVMIARDGTIKLADFGLALHGDSSSLTQTGAILGTPHCMAPEQFVSSRVDGRADIYSLGATLYWLLSGELPYDGDTLQELAALVQSPDPPPLPSTLREGIPPELDAICLKALEKHPDDRYADTALFAADLEAASRGEAVSVSSVSHISRFRRRLSARDPWALALVVVCVGLGLGSLVGPAWYQLVEGPRAEAKAELERQQAWDVLDAWALGLGAGPAPKTAELRERADALAAAEGRLPEGLADEARELRSRFQAAQRLVEHRAGREPSSGKGKASPTDRLVDAVLLLEEEGRVRAALGRVQQVLRGSYWGEAGRIRAHLWGRVVREESGRRVAEEFLAYLRGLGSQGHVAELALARPSLIPALEGWYAEVLRRAPNASPVVLREELETLAEAAQGQPLDLLRQAKLDALEAGAPDWERAAERALRGADAEVDLLLERLSVALRAEPAALPGPALNRCLDRIVAQGVAAWKAGRLKAQRCLELEGAGFRMDPRRASPPQLSGIALDAMMKGSYSAPMNPAFAHACVRCERGSGSEIPSVEALAEKIDLPSLERFISELPESRALRLLREFHIMQVNTLETVSGPTDLGWYPPRLAAVRAVIASGLSDISDCHLAEAHDLLATLRRLQARHLRDPSEKQRGQEEALEALRVAQRLDGEPRRCVPFYEAETTVLSSLGRREEIPDAWRRAEARARAYVLRMGNTLKFQPIVLEVLAAGAVCMFEQSLPEGVAWARRGLAREFQPPGADADRLQLWGILGQDAFAQGRYAEAAEILERYRNGGIEEVDRFSVYLAKLALREGRKEDALDLVEEGLRHHTGNPELLALAVRLKKELDR